MRNSAPCNRVSDLPSNQPWFVLNAATHYDLVTSSDPSISHFYSFEADQSNGLTFAIPDGCIDIVFDCDQSKPRALVCGTTLEARCADLVHQHRYFGVRFALGVVPKFLNIRADELVDQEIDLLNVVPEAVGLFEQVINRSSCPEQATLFQHFFRDIAPREPSPLTSLAVRLICENKGNIRVNELESQTGYTRRTLLRQFNVDIGLSPKAFSRIVRCQSAVCDINYREKVMLSDLAYDLGFSDQSHFLREFKKLVSTTPVDYLCRIKQKAYLNRIRCL